jgi:hypothetical protein
MFLIIVKQYTCKICNSILAWLRTGNVHDILVWHLACAVRKSQRAAMVLEVLHVEGVGS